MDIFALNVIMQWNQTEFHLARTIVVDEFGEVWQRGILQNLEIGRVLVVSSNGHKEKRRAVLLQIPCVPRYQNQFTMPNSLQTMQ